MPDSALDLPAMKNVGVVLIEDHTLVRHLLGVVLKEEPALRLVGDYANAAEGIKACLQLKPSLVVVDWALPDGKGIDVVRALQPRLPGTRFLFLSSLEREHNVREALDAGVHGFVMKRASYETLREAIRAVVAGKSFYCAVSSRLLVESMRTAAEKGASSLTARERDILRGIARGQSIKDIAHHLGTWQQSQDGDQPGQHAEGQARHPRDRRARALRDHSRAGGGFLRQTAHAGWMTHSAPRASGCGQCAPA
jgi:DNA-binding NarL/FixJ family response regulator